MNLFWVVPLLCPQWKHFQLETACLLHLGLLQASQCHLFLKVMCVSQTQSSETKASEVFIYISSFYNSFIVRKAFYFYCPFSSLPPEIKSYYSLPYLPSKRLNLWFYLRLTSDLKVELKEMVSLQLLSLKFFNKIDFSIQSGSIYRSLFHMVTSTAFLL